jgi:RHS repeat-associated protein
MPGAFAWTSWQRRPRTGRHGVLPRMSIVVLAVVLGSGAAAGAGPVTARQRAVPTHGSASIDSVMGRREAAVVRADSGSVTCDDFNRPNNASSLGTGALGTWQAWSPPGTAGIVDGEASLVWTGVRTIRYVDLGSIAPPFDLLIKHRVWEYPLAQNEGNSISVYVGLSTTPGFGTIPPGDWYLARYFHYGDFSNGHFLDYYPRARVSGGAGGTQDSNAHEFDANYVDGTPFYTRLRVVSGNQLYYKAWYAGTGEPVAFTEWPITNPSTEAMRYLVLDNDSGHEVLQSPPPPPSEWRIDEICVDTAPPPVLQTEPVPPATERNHHPNTEEPGDPVNSYNGSLTTSHTDVAIPGRGPSIAFDRTYNSNDPRVGPLGPGWTHVYDTRLVLADAARGDMYLNGPVGRSDRYVLQGDGSFTPPPGIHRSLVKNADGTFTATDKDQTAWQFDTGGRLSAIADRFGNTSALTYGAGGLLTGISDPAGRGSLTLGYTSGRLTSLTDWASPARTVTYQYDGSGRLWKVTDRENHTTTYTYDGTSSRIATIADGRGTTILSNTYDAQGRVATQKDARGLITGEATTVAYVDNGDGTTTTTLTLPPTSFEPSFHPTLADTYDANGWLTTRVTRPSSTETLTQAYTYDALGNRTSITDPRGNRTDVCYDVDYAGATTAAPAANLTRTVGPAAAAGQPRPVTLMQYDVKNHLIQTVSPRGVPSGTTVTCTTDLSAINTAFAVDQVYDAAGVKLLSTVRRFTDPDLGLKTATTKYEYGDPANPGRVTRTIAPRGNTTGTPDYAYATTMTYGTTGGGAGLLKDITDALGNKTSYGYDAVGHLISTIDPLGNAVGGIPADHTTSFTYDKEDRARTVSLPSPVAGGSPLVTETRYDNVGNPTFRIDANGQVTGLTYDERGSLFQIIESASPWTDPAVAAPSPIVTEYTHDAGGNATRITRAKGDPANERATDYTFDGRGLRRSETKYPAWPSTSGPLVTTVAYDGNGNQTVVVDASNRTTTSAYDALNRLTGVDYSDPATADVGFGYDLDGNRQSMTDGTGTTSYSIDEIGRVTTLTSPGPKTVGYRYDLDGNRSKLIYPDTTAVTYAYDNADRMSSLTDWASRAVSYTYWPDGVVKTAALPDGSTATYAYDNARRLVDVANTRLTTTITHEAYGLDRVGNVSAVTDYVATLTAAPTWSTASAVNNVTTADQTRPAIVAGGDGAIHAVWADTRSGDSDVYYARRDPATGAWSASERVNNVTTSGQTQPALAVDATGNVYVVWADARISAADDDIYFSKRSAATGTWSAGVRVNDDGAGKHQNDPTIAISSSGVVIAAWYDERGGGTKKNIQSARLPAGSSTWSANMEVTGNHAAVKGDPELAIGSDGTAYLAWRDLQSGNADIYFSSLPNGGSTWSANTKVSDDPGSALQDAPDIGVDTAGNLLAVWNDARTSPSQIRVRKRPAGTSTWSASTVIGGSTTNAPAIAVRSDGAAYASWSNGTLGSLTTLWGSQYTPASGTWSVPEQLTVGTEESAAAGVAFTTDQLVVAYQRRPSGGNYDIYSRRKALGGDESLYTYDRLYRLTGVQGPDGARTYGYDPAGNRTTRVAGTTTTYGYDRADRMTSAGASSVTTNTLGNTTAVGSDIYAYDHANRLVSTTVGGATETYAYDGTGTRFSRQVGAGSPIRYVTDQATSLPTVLDDGTRKYVYGVGLAYAVNGAAIEVFHTDRLGSIRAVTNSTGTTTAAYRQDEWGLTKAVAGSSAQPFQFTGEPADATGLSYLRARYYSPELGRFLTRDAWLGTPTSGITLNRFAYGNDNPSTRTDPSGHCVADSFIDVAFIVVDFWALASGPPKEREANERALGLDLLGLAIPCVTGLGAGERAVERLAINNERAGNFATRVAEKIGARPADAVAHHVFPVEFGDYFARHGIDINKGEYGTWIDNTEHIGITPEYRKDWAAFVAEEHTTQEIIDFGRMLGGKYGFDVHF